MDKFILQLATMPAVSLINGLTSFRKEVIKTGKYVHPTTKQAFEVTEDVLNHWVLQFGRWISAGHHVPIPLGHAREDQPEANAGWVTAMAVENGSLYCTMEILDPSLSLTTDVSICVEGKIIDEKGTEYTNVITHIALCTNPVIAGLEKFKKLSLSIGEINMEFLKKIGELLHLSNASEADVLTALEKKDEKVEKVELSTNTNMNSNSEYVVKMLSENRAIKLSALLKAGMITPAVKDVITAKYIEKEALTLSMSTKADDGFDLLYDVLVQNHPVKLEEMSGVQNLELSNRQVSQPKGLVDDMNKLRKEQGYND